MIFGLLRWRETGGGGFTFRGMKKPCGFSLLLNQPCPGGCVPDTSGKTVCRRSNREDLNRPDGRRPTGRRGCWGGAGGVGGPAPERRGPRANSAPSVPASMFVCWGWGTVSARRLSEWPSITVLAGASIGTGGRTLWSMHELDGNLVLGVGRSGSKPFKLFVVVDVVSEPSSDELDPVFSGVSDKVWNRTISQLSVAEIGKHRSSRPRHIAPRAESGLQA